MKIPVNIRLFASAILGLIGAHRLEMGDKFLGRLIVCAGIAIAVQVFWSLRARSNA